MHNCSGFQPIARILAQKNETFLMVPFAPILLPSLSLQ
jgi:hypothetical protein